MGSKKKEKAKIHFIGEATESVTGSMFLLEYKHTLTMIGCGMHQCRDKIKQYQVNSRQYKFKMKNLSSICIQEFHIDHFGNLAHMFNQGCRATIYAPIGSIQYFKIAFDDGLKITQKDADYIQKISGKNVTPLYTEEDIDIMLSHVVECGDFTNIQINEYVNIKYSPNYHVANSKQIEFFIKDSSCSYNKKILYGGDYGNIKIEKPFLEPFSFVESADVCLLETTYACKIKACSQKTRNKDIEKLKTATRETCIENNSTLLIPSFAFNRSSEILYELYQIYGEDSSFNIPILLDSPLAIKIAKMFHELIPEKDIDIWDKIMNWDNLKFIADWDDSESATQNDGGKIVIACSGFCDNGRVKNWLAKTLDKESATIVFIGFSDEGSLATEIKDGKNEVIKIDDLQIKNKAKVCNLTSFSSHMQHNELLETYSNINTNSIYLVHGEQSSKLEFAQLLENKCREKNRSTKVWIPYKDLVVEI